MNKYEAIPIPGNVAGTVEGWAVGYPDSRGQAVTVNDEDGSPHLFSTESEADYEALRLNVEQAQGS